MKIKLDENLPHSLCALLAELGHDVDTAAGEGLAGEDDAAVWAASQDAGRFLITQDLDFSDIRRLMPGSHHGILLMRLRDPGRRALRDRVMLLFRTEDVTTWQRCVLVATEHKLRVRRPA